MRVSRKFQAVQPPSKVRKSKLVVETVPSPAPARRVEPRAVHGHVLQAAALLTPVGLAVGIHDRVTGKMPKFHWDPSRQLYVTKDGRTMDQVATANQDARRARLLS